MNFTFNNKIRSREETIITPYRKCFQPSLPQGKQYWTLSALCGKDGIIVPYCELEHMVNSKLIQANQFFGVDYDKDIVENNKTLKTSTFLHGDFFQVMASYRPFNPGIVNMDCLRTFETEKNNIKKVFSLLQRQTEVFFNINVLLGNHNVKMRNPIDFIKFLSSDSEMSYFIRTNEWQTNINYYSYKGMGGNTKMMSIGLVRY